MKSFNEKLLLEKVKDTEEYQKCIELLGEDTLSENALTALATKLGLSGTVYAGSSSITGAGTAMSTGALSGVGSATGVATTGAAGSIAGGTAAGSVVLTAPFAILLASLGTVWVVYLVSKKAFRVMFLRKVKDALGEKIAKEAKDLTEAIAKLPKGNRQRDEAEARLNQIKDDMIKELEKK